MILLIQRQMYANGIAESEKYVLYGHLFGQNESGCKQASISQSGFVIYDAIYVCTSRSVDWIYVCRGP
jgi:hypothetical protein